MRTAILALAVLGLAAGCGGEAPQPAASAPADPAHERVAQDWPLPATMPGSAMPDLVSVGGSRLLLSWIHSPPGRRPALQFSSYDPAGLRWETAPVTIAVGASMVVNWADTPHIQASHDGALWVHWLQKTGASPHAYDVMLATSRDGGRSWSTPVRPHDDGTPTGHGFVSMWPQPGGGLGLAWLDGRNTAPAAASADDAQVATGEAGGDAHGADHDGPAHASAGAMALRATGVDAGLRLAPGVEIDARVCDCCQTSAALTARGPLLVYRGRSDGEVRDILATRLDGQAWTRPAPVHADGWTTAACPVNGPAVAAQGDAAVVAWYTEAAGQPEVRIARSDDAGDHFAAPVVVDAGEAVLGRVAVALDEGQAWLLWLREEGEGQGLWLSRRSPDLAREYQRLRVATLDGRGRATGFPKLALAAGVAHVVWTDVDRGAPVLRGARIVAR